MNPLELLGVLVMIWYFTLGPGAGPSADDAVAAAGAGAAAGAEANGASPDAAAGAAAGAAAAVKYSFHQGLDSGGGDIGNQGALANKPEELKAWCTAEPRCKGFNTNAWMKHTIKPQSQWTRWAANTPANAAKGFYLKL